MSPAAIRLSIDPLQQLRHAGCRLAHDRGAVVDRAGFSGCSGFALEFARSWRIVSRRTTLLRPLLGTIGIVMVAASAPTVAASADAPASTTHAVVAEAAVPGESNNHAAADTSDLGPTWEPPWNPSRPIPRRRMWEQIVQLPERIVSLPLSALGYVTQAAMLRAEDNGMIPLSRRAASARPPGLFALQVPGLGDRTGLGGAVVLRSPPAHGLPHLSVRLAATLNGYDSTRLGASLGPAVVEYGYDWRPQDPFYGVGTSTPRGTLSDFGAQDEYARGILHWGASPDSARGHRHVSVSAWGGPRSLVTRTGRDSREVSYEVRFPAIGSATLDRRVEHFVYGGRASIDGRSGRPHWSQGGRLALGVERYDPPIPALALHSARFEGAQFTRFTAEAEGGISVMRDPRSIRLLVRMTDQTVGSGRDHFLLSDMARLGGRDGLAGFSPGRFHDLDLLYGRLMYVFPLARLFEFEVHSEWGAAYPSLWGDVTLRSLKHSVGLSLRARSDAMPHGALGFDVSSEGVRLHYAWGGVE